MASKRHQRRIACSGKIQYDTQADAVRVLIRIRDPQLHSYKCRFCKKWHTGHTPSYIKKEKTA
jgi:hypothetical protein